MERGVTGGASPHMASSTSKENKMTINKSKKKMHKSRGKNNSKNNNK